MLGPKVICPASAPESRQIPSAAITVNATESRLFVFIPFSPLLPSGEVQGYGHALAEPLRLDDEAKGPVRIRRQRTSPNDLSRNDEHHGCRPQILGVSMK